MISILLSLCIISATSSLMSEEEKERACNNKPGEEYKEGKRCEELCESSYAKSYVIECNVTKGCFCKEGLVRHPKTLLCVQPRKCGNRLCTWTAPGWSEEDCWGIHLWGLCERLSPFQYPQDAVTCNGLRHFMQRERNHILYHLVDMHDKDAAAIRETMDEIEQETCLRWFRISQCCAPNDPLERPYNNYMNISYNKWCWVNAYHDRQGCNEVPFAGDPSRWLRGIRMHMLLLSMGLQSEIVRMDRNKYITIDWDNIMDGYEHFFVRQNNPYPFEYESYDHGSVLHYKNNMFAKNSEVPVIRAKNCTDEEYLGIGFKVGTLTELDYEKIKQIFGCGSKYYYLYFEEEYKIEE